MKRWVGALLAVAVLLGALWSRQAPVRAFGIYPAGTTGSDISYPQCGNPFPASPGAFAIVGVTGGRAFYQNPCLVSEYAWAQQAGVAPSLVLNLNAPSGTTAFKARTGPRGACAATDQTCLSYNYGYNAALYAFADAQSQQTTSGTWWLDVETENTWDPNSAVNVPVIQGAIDYLRAQGMTVGIYSTPLQWQQIAGSFAPGLPVWAAGAPDATTAPSYCDASHAFAGGTVWLVQYPGTDHDAVLACAAQTVPPPLPPPPVPPAAPTNLQAAPQTSTAVLLSWSAPATAVTGYWVFNSRGGPLLPVAGTATSYTVANLAPNTYYCFTIVAQNPFGYSGWSAWACVTTPAS